MVVEMVVTKTIKQRPLELLTLVVVAVAVVLLTQLPHD
jgi:hypothetical protein